MNFHIDNFHYFDKKLFHEVKEATPIEFDWRNCLIEKQKQFPKHFFIVLEKEKVVFIDTVLFSFIHIESHKNTVSINLDTSINESSLHLYILQLHQDEQHLKINSVGESSVTIFHENIVTQKGSSVLEITHDNPLNYYYINHHLSSHISHQQIVSHSSSIFNLYLGQREEKSKHKIDVQSHLYQQGKIKLSSLVYLIESQLRDDTIEVIHHDKETFSLINYFSLNGGKSVSQINTVIQEEALNSETKQSIKHILLNENSVSYSKPNLMIKNPLVVASHGNSIGSFNSDSLFYLSQRGITLEKAKHLIAQSYIRQFCENSDYPEQLLTYYLEENI